MAEVVVVGGGIVGVSVAYRLAQNGAKVTLLDAGALGGGTTSVSFAWLNANDKPPFPYHLLNVSGMGEYHRLRDEFGAALWLHLTGNTEWDCAENGPRRLREKVARLRDWGYQAELLPIRELACLEPDLVAPPDVEEFAFYPGEGYVDPVAVVGALAGAARACGAEIRTGCAVAGVLRAGDRVTGVATASGDRVPADVVVSCAGPWTNGLLQSLGLELPMDPVVGMVAVSAPNSVRLRAIHHDDAMNIRPDGAGRIMLRHSDFDAMVRADTPVEPVPPVLDGLLARVFRVLPCLAGTRIEAARIGVRPIPSDHYSAVGPVPGVTGLYAMATHSAVTLGPLLGRLLSDEILTGKVDDRLRPFRPERLIRTLGQD